MLYGFHNNEVFVFYPGGDHITVTEADGADPRRYPKAACRLTPGQDDTLLHIYDATKGEERQYVFDNGQGIEELYLWLRPRVSLHKHRNYAFLSLTVLLLALLLAGIWLSLKKMDAAANIVVGLTPRSWERPLANLALKQLQSRDFCAGEEGLRVIYGIARPLLRHAGLDGKGVVKIIFVKGNSLKSVALPGGVVIIESALAEQADSVDVIAAALSRELIEVKERRPLRRAVAKLGAYAVSFAAMPIVAASEPALLIGGKILRENYDVVLAAKTDVEAAALMQKSGYSPRGLGRYLAAIGFAPAAIESYNLANSALPPERALSAAQKNALLRLCAAGR